MLRAWSNRVSVGSLSVAHQPTPGVLRGHEKSCRGRAVVCRQHAHERQRHLASADCHTTEKAPREPPQHACSAAHAARHTTRSNDGPPTKPMPIATRATGARKACVLAPKYATVPDAATDDAMMATSLTRNSPTASNSPGLASAQVVEQPTRTTKQEAQHVATVKRAGRGWGGGCWCYWWC
jgi:hypothetical protein